jgi:ABC-2 type transport system ATP-binding protein
MLLQTENLTKDYGKTRALEDLTLHVAPGQIVGLLGPNGSGKTTALRLFLGFLKPTSGRAMIAGFDCWSQSVQARGQLAYLPGELRLYENMTARQLVRFLARLRSAVRPAAEDVLAKRLDIDLDRPLAQLSSGMKRKVALLQVLLRQAPLLILDEPTNTLDPTMRDGLLDQLVQARERGQAVLFSSHVLAEVERICDHVAILKGGRLVHMQALSALPDGKRVFARFQGKPPELPALPALEIKERGQDFLDLAYAGPLPLLLQWLSRQEVVDLRVSALGIRGIYQRFHGTDE